MRSVHDNHLIGYEVDGKAKRIVLRTEYPHDGLPFERTDVVFEGVEVYSFRFTCLVSIIFAIEEQPFEQTVLEHWSEFNAGEQGWPDRWFLDETKNRARISAMAKDGMKWFELNSSYGMDGWIIARAVTYVEGTAKQGNRCRSRPTLPGLPGEH
jgi:hypothetical protein